ncbi:MAG: carbohydrate binding domain-containing protein [Acholeplasmataceae bacterium]|nr:carbohydrate binding domain-containing protein [Acholeplasmataceae bacterium]
MKKRIIVLALVMLFGFFLASCEKTPEVPTLTSITISGTADVTLDFEEEFNILQGVTALGNDDVDYTADITYVTTSAVLAGDMLDTTKTGAHAIRYEVSVDGIVAQTWRYITVNPPQAGEGEMLVNPNFDNGTAGWDDPSVVYNADGSSMTLSVENGALKAEVVAGANPYTPRFGQMNVPFEQGKAYKVSFDAKSSVEKIINLQVGELLSASPWFTDFKPSQTEHRTITTEWANYEYSFMMTLDNQRGGVLFELGAISGVGVDATVWFDNILIEETTITGDSVAPMISGVTASVNVLVDDTFNPLSGVTASDNVDGDITDMITVEFFLVVGEVETVATAVDTSAEGVYKVVYTVSDAAGNETVVESMVHVILVLDYDYPGFRTYLNGAVGTLEVVEGALELNLTEINVSAGWHIQVIQDAYSLGYGADNVGSMNLEAGKTYKVTFDAKATTAGNITLAIGHAGGGWTPYFVDGAVAVTTELQSFSIEFTLDDTEADYSVPAQFKLEMGMLFAGTTAPQTFTLDNVAIDVLEGTEFVATDLIFNGEFMEFVVPEWIGYGTTTVVETETDVTITYADTAVEWWNNNAQLEVVNFDRTKEAILFTFTGVVGHEYLFKIEGGGAAVELPIVGDGTEQQLELSLASLTETQRMGLNLIIVFVKTQGASGSVVVKPWEYVIGEPEWMGYGTTTVVETETNVTINYTDTAVEWWNNNAQLEVTDFDGTMNQLLFTFTGVLGHEYLFKIEGGGQAKELAIVGTGVEQELLLPLDLMTEAQRDGLNLIIVFVKTAGASGSLVLNTWEYGPVIEPTDPEWTGYGTTTVAETETNVTITYTNTAVEWWNNNAQLPIVGFDGTKNQLLFTFTGVLGHEYLFKVEGGGQAKELAVVGTGVEQTLLLPLNDMTQAQREGLNLLIVFVKTETASGSLVLNTWEYGPYLWTGYNMTVVETETDVTITYPATPANWWENNAQLRITDFDGTMNQVLFTFTGVLGHEYLFKIEGGGQAKELAIVGTGVEQELLLPLDTMSEAQRDGLNLIIVFVKTEAAAGTLVLNTWEYGPVLAPADPEWVAVGNATVVTTVTETTITYTDTPANWWDNHAKLAVPDFNGATTSIVFTFTGVVDKEYVFKVEGGGAGVEVTVLATGAEQLATISLSTLNQTQKDGLNLLVVFAKTVGFSGTVVITNIEYVVTP